MVATREFSGSVTGCSPKTLSAMEGAESELIRVCGSMAADDLIKDSIMFRLAGSLTSMAATNELSYGPSIASVSA